MLAIVIPYYKLTFFESCLDSLVHQTDQRFRVYIGDDASLEDPSDLLKKYQSTFDFIYHRFEQNVGSISLVQQWERCVALTKEEEWLMILGDDDVLEANVVEEFYRQMPNFVSKTNVVRFSSRTIVEAEKYYATICTHPVWESAPAAYNRKFKLMTRSSVSEYVFSKSSYVKYGFQDYPMAWCSDDRAWLDFSDDKPIYTINEASISVRLSGLNITGKKDNLVLKNQSQVAFLNYIINNKLNYYSKYDRIKIIRKYHFELKTIRNLNSRDWLFLIQNYLIHADFSVVKGFIKKYI